MDGQPWMQRPSLLPELTQPRRMNTKQTFFSWTLKQHSQACQRETSQLNQGQANGLRSYTIDRGLSVRENRGDDNRGQRHGRTPWGTGGPAALTCLTNSLRNQHLGTDRVGRRVSIIDRGALFVGQPQLGGHRQWCQPRPDDIWLVRSTEHRVGD